MREFLNKIFLIIFRLLPIRKNKVLFIGYYGAQYGCNPKYLSEYFTKENGNLKIVWAFINPSKYTLNNIAKVKYYSIRYFYELSTAKVIISNYRLPLYFKKRVNQTYIQTWHSSLRLKMIENDAIETIPQTYLKMAKHDSSQIDILLSGCEFSTQIFKRAFWYDGEIFESGTPRCDILFKRDDVLINQLKNRLGISSTTKLLLYAPTFRKNNSLEAYDIDFNRLKTRLEKNENWKILIRLHPHLQNLSKELVEKYDDVIDVTNYDDIQQLLLISDLLITDYSSLMFDFAITEKPCIIYASDLNDYLANDRNLYFDITKLPFPLCQTNEELNKTISEFNYKKYTEAMKSFNSEIGSFEDGMACKRVYNKVMQIINQ